MNNLRFYSVDMKYIRDLAKADDNVLSVSPQNNKETRPFLGIILVCNNKSYCIPLTSPKAKHNNMKNREDFSRIVDSKGKIIGALNFNNMIPVTNDVITPLNIQINKNDDYSEKGRKKILNIQLDWCNNNRETIIRKANKLYHLVVDTPDKMKNLTRRCCDFKKLEAVLEKFISKKNTNADNSNADTALREKIRQRDKAIRDYENDMAVARAEGRAEGRVEGKQELFDELSKLSPAELLAKFGYDAEDVNNELIIPPGQYNGIK